jgi:hypothetical protein
MWSASVKSHRRRNIAATTVQTPMALSKSSFSVSVNTLRARWPDCRYFSIAPEGAELFISLARNADTLLVWIRIALHAESRHIHGRIQKSAGKSRVVWLHANLIPALVL